MRAGRNSASLPAILPRVAPDLLQLLCAPPPPHAKGELGDVRHRVVYAELNDRFSVPMFGDATEGFGAARGRTQGEGGAGVDRREQHSFAMTLQQPGRLHLQHEVWPVPVRPRAQQLEQTLPLHPKEDAPVEVLVPLAWRHLQEASLQGLLLHWLVVAHEGRAVFGVLYANYLRPAGGRARGTVRRPALQHA